MKAIAFTVCLACVAATATASPAAEPVRQVRFTADPAPSSDVLNKRFEELRAKGRSPLDALCACLLGARDIAESQGRIDFAVVVEAADAAETADLTAHVRMGSAYSVGRITFVGHRGTSESTLRRAMTLNERGLFDVRKLRRSLARLNETGLIDRLTSADIAVLRNADGVTADVTIPVRERKRRWWSLSGPAIPGLGGSLRASISSRLPPWGQGLFEASTYYVTFNAIGLSKPLLHLLPFISKAEAAPLIALERPYIPGQALLSGFAISPSLSPQEMLTRYARTHLARGIHAALDDARADALAVPVTAHGRPGSELLVCTPPKPRLWWLRRGGALAIDLAMAAF
jgi:hypothetical protein